MKRHTKLVIPSLFAVLGTCIFIGCASREPQGHEYVYRVKVDQVQSAASHEVTELSGVVKEAASVNLSFRVAGPIAHIYIKEGSYVTKGSVLAEIDQRDYALQLGAAQAEHDNVIEEVSRVKELYKRKSVSESDYQKAVAGEQMIGAKLKHAKDQFNDTKMYAPFDGYIRGLNFREGEIVNIGMPIASLVDVGHYNVEFDAPASLFMQRDRFVKVWCQTNLDNAEPIALTPVGYDVVANSSRLFHMVYRLDSRTAKKIAPGMEVRVSVEYRPLADGRIVVPIDAVFNHDGYAYVWIFNTTDSTISAQRVVTEKLAGNGQIVVNQGLNGSETIVTAGVNSLKEGLKVEVIAPKAKTNIGGLL